MSGRDLQAWRDACANALAYPDEEVLVQPDGKEFARIRARLCAICGSTWYGYVRLPYDYEPPRIDDDPVLVDGVPQGLRGTCGHPLCHKAESDRQWMRNTRYINACRKYNEENQTGTKIAR